MEVSIKYMELIIGGAFQGKLEYAMKRYGLTEDDVCDLAVCDPVPGYRCYHHLEALSRRNVDITRFFPVFENAVVIARQVNGGIVPMDKEERAWRERYGVALQQMAKKAEHVTRVFCGLAEELK